MEIYVQLRAACQKAGVLYLTQGRVFDFSRSDDAFMLGFEFLRAEADANMMRERRLRTVRIQAEKGRPHGRIPFGYRRSYDQRTGVLIGQEPDAVTGELVETMAREVLGGAPLVKVANMMQDLDVPTPQGSREGNEPKGWTSTTVKQILSNPTIAGKRVFQGEVIGEAEWEALVSPEDFIRLQSVLFDPTRRMHAGDGVTPKSLLSHIAICGYCARPLHRVLSRANGDKPRTVRYQCRFRGFKIVISAADLDSYITDYTLEWLAQSENVALLSGEDDDWIASSREARKHLKDLEGRLQEATAYCANGSISLAMLARIEQHLLPGIEDARRKLILPISDRMLRSLVSADDLSVTWNALPLKERRRIVKMLFDVRISKSPRRGRQGFQPERVTITPRIQPVRVTLV